MAAALKPEEVYLCVLCHYFVHPPASNQSTGEPLDPVQSSHRIALFMLKLLKAQPAARFPSLQQLCQMLVAQLGMSLGGELVQQLEVILTGLVTPDDLTNIMDAVGNLITATPKAALEVRARIAGIDPSSVMGVFLRRVRATFLLAPYAALTAAAAALQLDLQDSAAAAAMQQGMGPRAPCGSWRDPAGLHEHLTHQLRAVGRKGASAVDEDELAQLLGQLQTSHSAGVVQGSGQASTVASLLPRALQLQLATAKSQRDYTSALHALHAYIDHAQSSIAPGQRQGGDASAPGPLGGGKVRHQSSLVSLAALHTHFGHTQEALDALSEALRSAQQANDPWCLLHALAALAHLTATSTPGCPGFPEDGVASLTDGGQALQVHRLLSRCLTRAQELHCPHIASFARLCLARWAVRHTVDPAGGSSSQAKQQGSATGSASNGGAADDVAVVEDQETWQDGPVPRPPTLVVQEARRRVDHVAHMATLEAAAPPGLLGPATAAAGSAPGTAPSGRSPVITELYGAPAVFKNQNTWSSAQAMAEACMQNAGSSRLLAAAAWSSAGCPLLAHTHALAYLACWGAHSQAEDVELALAQIVRGVNRHQGPVAGQAAACTACTALPSGTQPSTRALSSALALVAHDNACNEGRLHAVRRLERQLHTYQDRAGHLDAGIELDGLLSSSVGALAAGDLSRARDLAQDGFTRSRITGHAGHAMEFLLQLGRVWLEAQQPAKAQQHLHSCLMHARAAGHDLLAAEAALLLARSWLDLGPCLAPETMGHLQDVLPVISAHGGPQLQAQAWWLLADALLVGATQEQLPEREEAARQLLEAAVDNMEHVGMWDQAAEAGHVLAMLYDSMGKKTEREEVARKVLWLRSYLRNVQLGVE